MDISGVKPGTLFVLKNNCEFVWHFDYDFNKVLMLMYSDLEYERYVKPKSKVDKVCLLKHNHRTKDGTYVQFLYKHHILHIDSDNTQNFMKEWIQQ